ncbi:hypothetical protein CAAN1_10S00562 [[Candida] anglica]|uniref:Uncharacterized protein n=1 Tax=[Candida] anglica TaxID=148631 RepID=A0ABP0EGM7_9ASCO
MLIALTCQLKLDVCKNLKSYYGVRNTLKTFPPFFRPEPGQSRKRIEMLKC